MFAKDLSNKVFSPPRHQGTKFFIIIIFSLCLGALVAILSGLSGLGLKDQGPLKTNFKKWLDNNPIAF